ncbi:MAG: hypothetical protein WCJ64_21990 [Rhodospirillaceae bacterium]
MKRAEMIHEANVIAIRRVYATAGNDAALVELRRRLMNLPERIALCVLVKMLTLPVAPPPEFRKDDMRHRPGVAAL